MPIVTCPACGSTNTVPVSGGFGCHLCWYAWRPPALPSAPPPEPAEPQEVAQVQGKVLGFRAWSLSGGLLGSVAQPEGWTVGVNEARCLAGNPHPAPAQGCQCGLYAYHVPVAIHPEAHVFGAILAWGRIEVHPSGFRAQYAEPVMLAYHDEQPYGLVRRAQALASEMGIECVQWDEYEREALKLGKPIAPELRPAQLPPGYYGYGPGVYIRPPTPSYYPSPRRKPP